MLRLLSSVVTTNRVRFWGIFWVDVSSDGTAKDDFIAIARMLGSEARGVEDAVMLLSNIKKPCLLILDNADDPKVDYGLYLPSDMQGAIVITSRVVDTKQHNTIGWEAIT